MQKNRQIDRQTESVCAIDIVENDKNDENNGIDEE